jgi:hypothetical protein
MSDVTTTTGTENVQSNLEINVDQHLKFGAISDMAYMSSVEFCELVSKAFKRIFVDFEGCRLVPIPSTNQLQMQFYFNHKELPVTEGMYRACTKDGKTEAANSTLAAIRRRDHLLNVGDRYFLTDDGKECIIDSPEAMEAIQLYYDLTNTYKVTPPSAVSYSWGEAQDAFLTGTASQIVLGSAAVYNFVNGTADMDWGATLIPKGPSGDGYASFAGGDNIGITSQCKDVDAAWDFILYSMTDDVQIERFAKGGLLPARSDQFDNEYFNVTPQYQVLKAALEVAHTPYSLRYDEMYDPLLAAMQNCLNGKASIEDTVAKIKKDIDAIVG